MSDKRVKSGLNQAVRDNIALGDKKRPWTEIATEHGVQLRTVYRRVAEQRARDIKLKRMATASNFGRISVLESGQEPKEPKKPKIDFNTLLTEAETSPVMSRDERLKVLSLLATTAPDAVKVAAIAKLEEFERAAGQQFGPPPPTTDEAMVNYLSELFDGISLDLIQEAINRVFTQNKQENEQITETISINTSDSDLGGCPTGE